MRDPLRQEQVLTDIGYVLSRDGSPNSVLVHLDCALHNWNCTTLNPVRNFGSLCHFQRMPKKTESGNVRGRMDRE